MQHESEVKLSRGFSAKARQIRSLCMQHESEVKMSRGADMTTKTSLDYNRVIFWSTALNLITKLYQSNIVTK